MGISVPFASSLDECLDSFSECVVDDWKCDHCRRADGETRKRMRVACNPEVMVIHIKRSRADGSKITGHVAFEERIEVISLSFSSLFLSFFLSLFLFLFLSLHTPPPPLATYYISTDCRRLVLVDWGGYPPRLASRSLSCLYVSVLCVYVCPRACRLRWPLGRSLGSGHYVARCLVRDGCWVEFDDSRCRRVASMADVLASNAYVLVYQRERLPGDIRERLYQEFKQHVDEYEEDDKDAYVVPTLWWLRFRTFSRCVPICDWSGLVTTVSPEIGLVSRCATHCAASQQGSLPIKAFAGMRRGDYLRAKLSAK